MTSINEFQDKANRLINRLSSLGTSKFTKTKAQINRSSISQLSKIKQEIQYSQSQARKKMRILGQNMRKVQQTISQQNISRQNAQQTFSQVMLKMQKNLKTSLGQLQKHFLQKQKKIQQKIMAMIRNQKKEIQTSSHEAEQLLSQVQDLEIKVNTIADQLILMRRTRIELQQKITKQFSDQVKQLKKLFQSDTFTRQQREERTLQSLKNFYKQAIQKIYQQQQQRTQTQTMLMSIVQQLITHIIDA